VTGPHTPKKSEATRALILDAALELFRKQGFADTTMREVADAAGMSLGAAYYYFPSKDSLLLGYYARNQADHEARITRELVGTYGMRERLGVVIHQKLHSMRRERRLLGALVQRLADPSDPISAFAVETRAIRERSMAVFAGALHAERLPAELERVLVAALWTLHMGLMLYFVHDRSPRQQKTHRLVDDTLDLVVPLVMLGRTPLAAPLLAQLTHALGRAGLLQQT
jgi:AcrR family transcriptional regulator